MHLATRVLIVVGCLLLIPITAVLTAAAKQRLSVGSDFVFSGSPLVSGELHTGLEPDWSFRVVDRGERRTLPGGAERVLQALSVLADHSLRGLEERRRGAVRGVEVDPRTTVARHGTRSGSVAFLAAVASRGGGGATFSFPPGFTSVFV